MRPTRPSQDIKPLSEFRANVATFVEHVQATKRPLVLTQHGRSAAILLAVGLLGAIGWTASTGSANPPDAVKPLPLNLNPDAADPTVRVRGIGLRIAPPDGQEWRTAMIDPPFFPVSTPQAFYELLLASTSTDPDAMKTFAGRHPEFAAFGACAPPP